MCFLTNHTFKKKSLSCSIRKSYIFIFLDVYILRNKGFKRILPEELRTYPEPFASEETFFEEMVLQGFFVRIRVPLRILFIQRTLCGIKSSSRIVKSMGVKRSSLSYIQMFTHVLIFRIPSINSFYCVLPQLISLPSFSATQELIANLTVSPDKLNFL